MEKSKELADFIFFIYLKSDASFIANGLTRCAQENLFELLLTALNITTFSKLNFNLSKFDS